MNFHKQGLCSLGEISKKHTWKLENMVTIIYKTVSNTNIVSVLKLFAYGTQTCIFVTLDDILVEKVIISASLRKINFPTILKQAPLQTQIAGLCLEVRHHFNE